MLYLLTFGKHHKAAGFTVEPVHNIYPRGRMSPVPGKPFPCTTPPHSSPVTVSSGSITPLWGRISYIIVQQRMSGNLLLPPGSPHREEPFPFFNHNQKIILINNPQRNIIPLSSSRQILMLHIYYQYYFYQSLHPKHYPPQLPVPKDTLFCTKLPAPSIPV